MLKTKESIGNFTRDQKQMKDRGKYFMRFYNLVERKGTHTLVI